MSLVDVIVLYGGRSTEHDVSRRSAAFVLRHLDSKRFKAHPVAIDPKGRWWPQDSAQLLADAATGVPIHESSRPLASLASGCDPWLEVLASIVGKAGDVRQQLVVFPVIHGSFGEDGTLQGLLDLAEVAYVGPDTMGSAIGMDKVVSKKLAAASGVPIVPSVDLRGPAWQRARGEILQQVQERLGPTVFVKPARLGSSVGVSKARDRAQLERAIDEAFIYDEKVLIETALSVREIECAILGGYEAEASCCGEVVAHTDFYDYEAKYLNAAGSSVVVPAELTPEQVATARAMALQVFSALDLYGMARVDLFLERTTGRFYFNEVNTVPGFTAISQYPMLWKASGVDGTELVSRLIDLGIARQRARASLRRSL